MADFKLPATLVTADWLRDQRQQDRLLIFDASWHMPASGRDGMAEWRERHVPGAVFFDFDQRICAPRTELPHMLPDAAGFTRELQALGLNQDSVVVIYDSLGMFSGPRAWWMLRAMGFAQCALLDGGLPAWVESGFPLESAREFTPRAPGNFVARLEARRVADAAAVLAALEGDTIAVLDARPEARFSGAADEPRPGLRRGHMPGARNLPFAELFEQGRLKSRDELQRILAPLLSDRRSAIYSCGSGVTACILAFAADYCGYDDFAVYDGSWCEWGQPGELPVVID